MPGDESTQSDAKRDNGPAFVGVECAPSDVLDRQHYEAVVRPWDQAESLAPWCYTSQAFFDAECARVFRRGWNCIGRADRISKSGDYAAFRIAGVPVLLVRDEAGELRAFANACRHRGTQLLRGEGNCRAVICPFHGWTYRLDGRLAGAPQMERTADFRKEDHGLLPIRLACRDGFAFLSFDPDASSLDDWLGDFSDLHAPWCLADMVTARRKEIEVACNWKLYLEVFNEYYHLRSVHAKTLAGMYDSPDPPEPTRGHYVTQFGTNDGSSGLLEDQSDMAMPTIDGLAGRNREGTRYTWLFPGFAFAASKDAIWMHEVYPTAPNRTTAAMTVCFAPAASTLPDYAARAAAYFERLDVAIAEDIAVLEQQQAGLDSPLARPGRFSWMEPNVSAFANWLARRIVD